MPSPFLLIAACFAMSASTMLAMIWPEADEDEDMEAIGLDKVIFVWLYTLAWSFVQDLAKVITYQLMEKAGIIATADTLTAKDVEGLSIISAYEDLGSPLTNPSSFSRALRNHTAGGGTHGPRIGADRGIGKRADDLGRIAPPLFAPQTARS
eukprot:7701404-Pyramimonas_sp.AAC.1